MALTAWCVAAPAWPADLFGRRLDATATLVSDYRFRGVSLSGHEPAVTVSVDTGSSHGLFAGVFAASGVAVRRSDPEIDLYAGWRGPAGPVTATLGVTHYAYPGSARADFTEAFGSVEHSLGPVSGTLGVDYAPRYGALRGDNLYVYALATAGIPGTSLTLRASVGRESGARTPRPGATLDYMAGVETRLGAVVVGLRYVGNESDGASLVGRRERRGAVVASITATF